MSLPNLSLLYALDALLKEESIAGAAARQGVSASAMSRSIAQLRDLLGDQLLVRAGADFVLTQRALNMRDEVARLVSEAEMLLRSPQELRPETMTRRFVVSAGEGFVETYGADLITRVTAEAPNVRLNFVSKVDASGTDLRHGKVDVEIGVIADHTAPEIRTRALYRDHFVGVVRDGHRLLQNGGTVSLESLLAERHVALQRGGVSMGPVDQVLAAHNLERDIAVTVSCFSTALSIARRSDLVAAVPERSTRGLRTGLQVFNLPMKWPKVTVSMMWHPRRDGEAENQWLRDLLYDVCGTT